ncbi:hypothetical protein Tco_1268434 [Tanacetum coccineum]
MSDSNESGVTHTEISSLFEDLSDIGLPRADDHEYLELPWMPEDPYVEAALQAPPSPDYVPGPKEPEQASPSPDYVLGPEHADDEIVAEDQPYAKDASPTAQSPDYVPESDPEADPEEDDNEDPEEDRVDYPADGGDDGDDEDEPSEDDEDNDMDIEADNEEEEEHRAPTNSIVVALLATDQASSTEEIEPFETDESAATPPPHPAYRVTARISILAPVPVPAWSDSESHSFIGLSSCYDPGERRGRIYFLFTTITTTIILSYIRSDAPSLGIPPPLPISVPISSPPLLLPSTSHREDRTEVTLPPRKRLGIAPGPRYKVGESSYATAARPTGGLRADYGFIATMDREIRHDPEREVGYGIIDLQDTDEIYTRLDNEQSQRQLLAGRLNMLFRDRRAHVYTRHLMETKARLSREAWRRSMDASDLAHGEAVTSEMLKADHRRSAEIRELRIADHNRQDRLPHCRDSRDPLEVLHSQSCQRRLVAVRRLDHVMASHFIYSLLSITGSILASMALGMDKAKITRKPSKTCKHGHGKRKSTKEAGKSSQS